MHTEVHSPRRWSLNPSLLQFFLRYFADAKLKKWRVCRDSFHMPGFKQKLRLLRLAFTALLTLALAAGCRGFFVNPTLQSVAVSPTTGSVAPAGTIQMSRDRNFRRRQHVQCNHQEHLAIVRHHRGHGGTQHRSGQGRDHALHRRPASPPSPPPTGLLPTPPPLQYARS